MPATRYDQESTDIRAFVTQLADGLSLKESDVAKRARQLLASYAERLEATELPEASIAPARYAMAVFIDDRVRALRSVQAGAWNAAASVHIFDSREMTIDSLRQFHRAAAAEGDEYTEFSTFLEMIIAEIEGTHQIRATVSRTPAVLFAGAVFLYLVSLAAYVAFLDYRYHVDLLAGFETALEELPAEKSPERLATVARLYHETERASASAPLSRLITLPFWVSGPMAEEVYRTETAEILPDALREAIAEALATEGDSLALYDTVRAWAILTGRTDWHPAFLAGWVEDRSDRLGLGRLADHVAFLDGPEPRLAVPDQELFEQARSFATEATEAERAFLELNRLPQMRALGRWNPAEQIAEFDDVFIFRSGKASQEGVPGMFTRSGWDLTKNGALDQAIRVARIQATKLLPQPGASSLNTRSDVFNRLQDETVSTWKAWLDDLRVRPFTDSRSAVRVSGALSRRNSALLQVVEAVWAEAGGNDPTRPTDIASRVEAVLGPAIIYVRSPEFAQMRGLFSSLNVALSTMDRDASRGIDALLGLQERAQAGAVLKTAPPLVSQIAEDVLAQTSATHANVLSNPLTREWQTRVYPICQRAIDGGFPFHTGGDVDFESFDAFFGMRGALRQFHAQYGQRNLDTNGDTWRWSADVRLSGVSQESAAFLQRAMALADVFYGVDQRFGTSFDLAPLAARGTVQVSLGGRETPMVSEGVTLNWPGDQPLDGMAVSFSQEGSLVQLDEPGLWGFLRVLEQTSIRSRDEGRRQLVDLRVGESRVFFEMSFPTALNPVAARGLLQGITCPPVL